MPFARRLRPLAAIVVLLALSACALQRADDAAAAKTRMPGLTRAEVLACMGPPKRKASDGAIEVWSYLSTDRRGESVGNSLRAGGLTTGSASVRISEHDSNFCTVNVVMKNGVVKAVNYNGPSSSSIFARDDECGYAVKNCVPHEAE